MRVLYVGRSLGTHDRRFIDAWSAAGYQVEAIAVDEVEGGGALPGPAFAARLGEVLVSRPPDVVQVGPTTWPGSAVVDQWQGPLIAASWGFDLMHDIDEDPAALEQARTVLRRADLVFVDNAGPARRALELGVDPARIVSFPWGIALETFDPADAPRDEHLIVSVRRHEPLYRVADVLDAFALAAPADPRLRLLMAGSGSLTDSLKQRAVHAGVADRVQWLGDLAAPALAELLGSSGVYVSTSPVDGSSVSLLEAMASGATAVVTDIEGNREWVDESTGWTFAAGDVAALAGLMVQLTTADDERDARRAHARARVRERADWSATVARFPSFAQAAIEASRGRSWIG